MGRKILCFIVLNLIISLACLGQNPLIRDQFTADPSARVIGDKIYVFPSHDIKCESTQGRPNWFCMEDYHVFSSANLTDWEDHGVIVSQYDVPWADSESFSMWAPDAIEKEGKFYFYFPSKYKGHQEVENNPNINGSSFKIGVAVADNPEGPYNVEERPIAGVDGIDPNVFIDKDGQGYLFWSQHDFFGAKLKDNMIELEGEPKTLKSFPAEGLKEGPFIFERNGVYYMTYPHVENKTERIEYATAEHPLGPYTYKGVIMDESPTGCWTNHQSIVEYGDQWYLFYHHNDYSPDFDKNRSIRADSLFFTDDGLIKKVKPTYRGIGLTSASSMIQLDRYSEKSANGYSFSFLDENNPFQGWKSVFSSGDSWVRYNSVDFGKSNPNHISARLKFQKASGELEIKAVGDNGEVVLSSLQIDNQSDWTIKTSDLITSVVGLQDIIVTYKGEGHVEVDWITFN
ncbi:family 43 glycosylhydrolase [Litoribacter alkaliphilus]|uniref:Family 43 glycosylhydrolase n=1 Tax=Litoribacter ruber TaxID=702568 RepID=A0AAP2CEC2_9BACT|nr:family 43 glycosylhydrolase [Litoribacter alkaliphilus]MBS9522723.1 family 43 glycosylhydrolase [Litoribacter alkaliphilus]